MINKIINKVKKIKLIATDIDGVWTDSKMYYSKDGVFMKAFSTYDGMGADLLLKNNFIIAMITSEYENVDILKSRAKKLNIHNVYSNSNISLYDILGKNYEFNMINNYETNSISVNTSNLEPGLYFLRLEDINTGHLKILRLIKQ